MRTCAVVAPFLTSTTFPFSTLRALSFMGLLLSSLLKNPTARSPVLRYPRGEAHDSHRPLGPPRHRTWQDQTAGAHRAVGLDLGGGPSDEHVVSARVDADRQPESFLSHPRG